MNNGDFTLGMCDTDKRIIYVSDWLEYAKYKHVLTHELCHAFISETDIFLPIETEESICNMVASHSEDILEIVEGLSENFKLARA